MMEETLIPLMVASELGRVQGRTRFQKLVFLVQQKAKRRKLPSSKFDFELYRYGPFSMELSAQLERLVSLGYLGQFTEITPVGYSRYSYRLTETGKALLEESKRRGMIDIRLRKLTVSVSHRYGNMTLPHLVSEAYNYFR